MKNIGPSLPPSMNELDTSTSESNVIGPAIPERFLSNPSTSETADNPEEEDEIVNGKTYGPTIPSKFSAESTFTKPSILSSNKTSDAKYYGPMIPGKLKEGDAEEDNDDDFGPMPVQEGTEDSEMLERAYRFAVADEMAKQAASNQPKREEWMISVPKKLGNFGLGPRTFKRGGGADLDSSWEDTPSSKKSKKLDAPVKVQKNLADTKKKELMDNVTKGPSLLELHQKDRRDPNKRELQPGERRPFDREKDMEVRGLKPGADKEAVDRLKELGSRFTSSREQKFL